MNAPVFKTARSPLEVIGAGTAMVGEAPKKWVGPKWERATKIKRHIECVMLALAAMGHPVTPEMNVYPVLESVLWTEFSKLYPWEE